MCASIHEPYFMDTRVPELPRRAQTPSRLLHASWAGYGQMSAAQCCGVSLWVAGLPNAAQSPGTGPTTRGACCEPGQHGRQQSWAAVPSPVFRSYTCSQGAFQPCPTALTHRDLVHLGPGLLSLLPSLISAFLLLLSRPTRKR